MASATASGLSALISGHSRAHQTTRVVGFSVRDRPELPAGIPALEVGQMLVIGGYQGPRSL
jgi:hypothetical protein